MAQTIKKSLLCKLTAEEVDERARENAEVCHELIGVEKDKKAAMAAYKERLDRLNAQVKDLTDIVKRESEYRLVDCYETPDLTVGRVRLVRCDTGETVSTRRMTLDEQQFGLDLDGEDES